MVDVTRQVQTEFTLIDRVTAPLRNIQQSADKVASIFDNASKTVAKYGALATTAIGGFALGSTLVGTQRYLQTVRDITQATGFASENVDATLELFDRANISAQEGSQIIQKLSISMQRYKMEVMRTGKAQSDASRIIEKLGINLDRGPVEAMKTLADQATRGKLTMADLNIGFQVSETSAIRLQALLKRGPQEVGRIMTELKQQGLALTANNLASFSAYEEATIRIRSAWNRIAIVVGVNVLPVITRLLEKVRDRLEGWTLNANSWGETVSKWLDNHLGKVILIGKVMLANAALQATFGTGLGKVISGGVGMASKVAMGAAGYAKTAAPAILGSGGLASLGSGVAGAITKSMQPFTGAITKLITIVGSSRIGSGVGAKVASLGGANISNIFTSITGGLTTISGSLGGIIGTLGRAILLFGKLTLIGALITGVIALIVYTYDIIKNNTLGIRDIIMQWWDQLKARVLVVWDLVRPLFVAIGNVLGPSGPVGQFFGKVLIHVINSIGSAVDGMLLTIQVIIILFKKLIDSPLDAIRSPVQTFVSALAEAQMRTMKRMVAAQEERAITPTSINVPSAPRERPPPTINDFRGSKFDIKQNFAEGFDPDRIAVAFTNDLAALGEKRLQSGYAPLFAVR